MAFLLHHSGCQKKLNAKDIFLGRIETKDLISTFELGTKMPSNGGKTKSSIKDKDKFESEGACKLPDLPQIK